VIGFIIEMAKHGLSKGDRIALPAHSDEVGRGFRAKAAACTD
jgi:hypothetical protein